MIFIHLSIFPQGQFPVIPSNHTHAKLCQFYIIRDLYSGYSLPIHPCPLDHGAKRGNWFLKTAKPTKKHTKNGPALKMWSLKGLKCGPGHFPQEFHLAKWLFKEVISPIFITQISTTVSHSPRMHYGPLNAINRASK